MNQRKGTTVATGRRVVGKQVKFASVADVEAAATGWNQGQLDCRSGLYSNHNWQPFTARRGPKNSIGITQQCSNCKNRRHRRVSSKTGRPLDDWAPLYREGYLMPKGQGRIGADGKAALTLIALTHLTITDGGEESA